MGPVADRHARVAGRCSRPAGERGRSPRAASFVPRRSGAGEMCRVRVFALRPTLPCSASSRCVGRDLAHRRPVREFGPRKPRKHSRRSLARRRLATAGSIHGCRARRRDPCADACLRQRRRVRANGTRPGRRREASLRPLLGARAMGKRPAHVAPLRAVTRRQISIWRASFSTRAG
jgi:hypothetical protein